MSDDDSFFLNPILAEHGLAEHEMTRLWLVAGITWLLALVGSALGAGWLAAQSPRRG